MNISKPISDKRGITLIELVITISLLVVILGAVALFTRPMRGLFAMNQVSVELKEESNVMLELLANRLRNVSVMEIGNFTSEASMSDGTKSYLYTKNGTLYYKKKTAATKVLVDAALYQPYHLHLHFVPSQTKNKGTAATQPITLNISLWFLSTDGTVVFERESGFELLNMRLTNAELKQGTVLDESYVQVIVFEED